MFCFQCEQTRDGKGCETIGVCGKTPDVAALQDLLIHMNKGISQYSHRLAKMGVHDAELDIWVLRSMFATLTNVNFDEARFVEYLNQGEKYLAKAKVAYEETCKAKGVKPETLTGPATTKLDSATDIPTLVAQGNSVGVKPRGDQLGNADILGLQELIVRTNSKFLVLNTAA
jgi:hydroxylamine reductase